MYSVMRQVFLPRLAGMMLSPAQLLADVSVVEFAIELSVGQHQTESADGVNGIDRLRVLTA